MAQRNLRKLKEDTLIARAANGDSEARHVLASRFLKLRWIGHEAEAAALRERARHGLPNDIVRFGMARETD